MELNLLGVGAWGPGFASWNALRTLLRDRCDPAAGPPVCTQPIARILPDKERRRAPLPARIAAEVALQALESSGLSSQTTASVFASCMGDVGITDRMCRTLNTPGEMLSPTLFHNSVHNASAGYWSIAAASHETSTSVCAFRNSFQLALLEAGAYVTLEARPVLLVITDLATAPPLDGVYPNPVDSGYALALAPPAWQPAGLARLRIVSREPSDRNIPFANGEVAVADGPACGALSILRPVANRHRESVRFPAGSASTLVVDVSFDASAQR